VGDLARTVIVAASVFAGTNVDDLLVLTVLFLAAHGGGRARPAQIWLGQYLGMAALVAVSFLAALGLAVVPDRWVGLLGLVPLALGVGGLVTAARRRGGDEGEDAGIGVAGVLPVAGLTVANGADNVSVYTPMFRSLPAGTDALTVIVFAAGVAAWCLAGSWLGGHRAVVAVVRRAGQWLVPAVFVAVGTGVLASSAVKS